MASYYPRAVVTFKDLQKAYPDYEMINDEEEQRLEDIEVYARPRPLRAWSACSRRLTLYTGRSSVERAPPRRSGPRQVSRLRALLLSSPASSVLTAGANRVEEIQRSQEADFRCGISAFVKCLQILHSMNRASLEYQ